MTIASIIHYENGKDISKYVEHEKKREKVANMNP